MDFVKDWGMIAGIAGIALGVFVILFRKVINKRFFTKLSSKQSFIVILLFLILVWSISLFSITVYFKLNEDSTQLTIYVHGPRSKQEIVLENIGSLIVDFDNDRRSAMIGQNGRTNFGEIPKKFKNKEIGIGLEAPGYVLSNPNEKYILNGNPIYLSVKNDDSLGKISGIIKNRDGSKLIMNALILIGNDTSIVTDEYGIFKIILPESMQVKDSQSPYLLTVRKDGYKITTEYYYPKSGDIEIRLE
jgi:hypothetical protein